MIGAWSFFREAGRRFTEKLHSCPLPTAVDHPFESLGVHGLPLPAASAVLQLHPENRPAPAVGETLGAHSFNVTIKSQAILYIYAYALCIKKPIDGVIVGARYDCETTIAFVSVRGALTVPVLS